MEKKVALFLVFVFALILRLAPIFKWNVVMGVDAYYHMRLMDNLFLVDNMYAGTRISYYPLLFHILMKAIPLSTPIKAKLVPAFISSGTIFPLYYLLKNDGKIAIISCFLFAINPAIIWRTYFFPEILVIFIVPLLYKYYHKKHILNFIISCSVIFFTHIFSAIFYFFTMVSWRDRDARKVILILFLALSLVVAFVQGPSLNYVRKSFIYPVLTVCGGYYILAMFAIGDIKEYFEYFIVVLFSIVVCFALPQEATTYRIQALSAVALSIVCAAGVYKIYEKNHYLFACILIVLSIWGISFSIDKTPIYYSDDINGTNFLADNSVSPVMSTAGHLATYCGSIVLVDEYYPYSVNYDERFNAQIGIISRASKDYSLPQRYGVRLIFIESSLNEIHLDSLSMIYNGNAQVYIIDY
ncbi:MAG: hypothetical protein ACXQTP_01890 [Candidatus Methanofastidiosia archaeon]